MTDRNVSVAFLQRVLPPTGPYSMRYCWRKGGPPTRIEYADTIEQLWNKLDSNQWCDTFFTTGSLRDKSSPEAKNIAAKRAFYLDIDKDPEAALIDVLNFCKVMELPAARVVRSGRGLHAWWPLEKPMHPSLWLWYAAGLKQAAKKHGLAADPACTADVARILRCPGTFNHKHGSPVEVEIDERFFNYKPFSESAFDTFLEYTPIVERPLVPPAAVPTTLYNDHTAEYYSSMLASISKPESYGDALRVGMALHSLGWGEPALEMWTNWYEGSPEQQSASGLDRDQLAAKWLTFSDPAKREVVVTPGTLDHLAKETGWAPPGPKPAAVISPPVYTPPPGADPDDPFIKHCAEVSAKGWEANKEGCPVRNSLRNARMGLVHLQVRARHNLVSGVSEVFWSGKWQRKTDTLSREVRIRVMELSADPGKDHVGDALQEMAESIGPFNPIRDYLNALSWDGEPRLDTWLQHYCGAADTELNRSFGATVLIAAVRRAINDDYVPFDYMLVLIGPQGTGKSTIVRILGLGAAPKGYYKNQLIAWSDSKSPTEVLRGCWFYEWADLSGHSRLEDNRIKSLLSTPTDEGRLSYRRDPEPYVRRAIFIATTNSTEFIKDQTGARRYWPVQTGSDKFRLDEFRSNIDQLYAEAVVRERTYGPYLGVPSHLLGVAKEAQSEQTELPRLYDTLLPVQGEKRIGDEYISTADIKARWLPGERQTTWLDRDIKEAMTKLGWTYCQRQVNGVRARGYERPVGGETSEIQEPQSAVLSDALGVCSPEVWAVPKVPTRLN
jgi:hypothetical protein